MRENALQYHARMVSDFYDALLKGDASDEAVNVLMSAQNLRNEGVTTIPVLKDAKKYLRQMKRSRDALRRKVENPIDEIPVDSFQQSKVITSRSTKHEPARRPQHRAIRLFHVDDWVKAHDENNQSAIDAMTRKAHGWRMQTTPNTQDYDEEDITHPHHPIHALNLHPTYEDHIPSYHSKPIFQQLMRAMFSPPHALASQFNKKMIQAAKKMHPSLKKDTILGNWSGQNFTIEKMFDIGYQDFKKDFVEKFGEESSIMKPLFVWCKQWENEGLPRDYIFKQAIDENNLQVKEGAGVSLHQAVKDDARIQTDDGQWVIPSRERTGTDAYVDGVYMLPADMQRDITYWKLNGAQNSSDLKKIVGNNFNDVLGYMALHNRLMKTALRDMYSGGSLRRGFTHITPNRYLNDSTVKDALDSAPNERIDKFANDIAEGRYRDLSQDVMKRTFEAMKDSDELNDALDEYADANDLAVYGHGMFPKIVKNDFFGEDSIEMEDDMTIEDLKTLAEHGFFKTESGKKFKQAFAHQAATTKVSEAKIDTLLDSMSDLHYTHTNNEDWLHPDDARHETTAYGMLMDVMGGGGGNFDFDFDDFAQLREDAMPGVWFENLPVRNVLPAFRQDVKGKALGTKYGRKKGRMREAVMDTFKPNKKDEALNEQQKTRLRNTAQRNGYGEEETERLVEQFEAGNEVRIRLKERERPMRDTEEFVGEEMEDYTRGMPLLRRVTSDSLTPFVGSEAHFMSDPMDETSMMGLDGLREERDTVSPYPMARMQLLRDNADSKGHNRLFFAEQLAEGVQDVARLNHDRNNPQHRLAIGVGLLGAHEPLDVHDDDALDAWKKGQYKSMNRTDPTGRVRDSDRINSELFDTQIGSQPMRYSIYSLEDYQKYLDTRYSNDEYVLPSPISHGGLTDRELKQELIALDDDYDGNKEALGKRVNQAMTTVDKAKKFGTIDGVEYVIAPDEHSLAQNDTEAYVEQLKFTKDDVERDFLMQKINSIGANSHLYQHDDEKESSFHNKLQLGRQTHDVVKEIFDVMVRPAIEAHYPKAFGYEGMTNVENNEATAMTAYGLHIAEYIATHLTPDEQSRLMAKGKTTGYTIAGMERDKQTPMHTLITPEMADRITNLRVRRNHHDMTGGGDRMRLAHEYPDGLPKGHELANRLFDGNNRTRKIFNKVIEKVQEAANEQGISFEDAFVSRYLAHNRLPKPLSAPAPSKIQDIRRGGRKEETLAAVIKDPHELHGDIFENLSHVHNRADIFKLGSEKHGILHGGDAIFDEGKPLSMQKEFDAIHAVMKQVLDKTKMGSDVAVLGKGIRQSQKQIFNLNEIFPSGSKKDRSSKLKKLRSLAFALNDQTTSYKVNKDTTHSDLPVGGGSPSNATLIPLYLSRHNQFEFGKNVKPPVIINKDALKRNGNFLIETPNNAQNPLPNNGDMRLVVSRDGLRDANPLLQPYDYSASNHISNDPSHFDTRAQQSTGVDDPNIMTSFDRIIDDSIITKEDGKPQPVKFMHRIFDLKDMEHLRGFTGDWVISLYPQGEHVIATKKKNKLTAYSTDGEVELDEKILEEAGKVYEKDFTVHAILHDGMMTVIDLLKTADEDTHNMPTKDRIRHLRAQYESSEHIKMPEPINTKRSDDEGLAVAIEGLRKEKDMDILLRDANATYMKGEPRHPKWVLLTKEKMVDVVILSRSGKNYTIGVGPLMHPEHYGKRAQEIDGEHYMMVGSAKGPRGLKEGDFATVQCTGVSASNGEHPTYRIRSGKITDNEPLAADSVETLAAMSGEHHVAQRVAMKKGNIIINFPAFDDDVICKTRIEDDVWIVEPQSSVWGNEYLVRLAHDQEPYWELKAAMLLKEEGVEEPEYDEVKPEPPAGHSKKRKHVLEDEEEVIKRGLHLIERGLEHIAKEKITSTGVQGLGMDYATPDESPRGPTQNINDDTMPDFDPAARDDSEEKPATAKKTKRLRTSEGEVATLEDDGVIAIENSSLDIP